MRIALFSECYTPVANGVVTSVRTLRDTLRGWGHTVALFAPGAPQPDDDPDVFRLPDLPFPDHPYHLARPFQRLKIDFAAMDFDIVHCQHPFTVGRLGAYAARKAGVPMVYTAHSLYDIMVTYARSPILRRVGVRAARGIVRQFCGRAETVIVPTRHVRDALRKCGVRSRFVIVPSGVARPHVPEDARTSIRAAWGIPPSAPLILYVGRLGPEKRVDLLLNAIAILANNHRLPERFQDFRVAMVGDGSCRAQLERMATALGIRDRILFVGVQPYDAVGAWYGAADLFALPCPSETQGLVLVEAMAAGLPAVAVDAGGPREVVVQGQTGLRVPFEAAAFARALALLLCDPDRRARMSAHARDLAQEYSPSVMARSVLAVYEGAIASYRPRTRRPRRRRLIKFR
jgi:glycosyltransferase involved in cell wall biosynthesis